MSHSVTAKTLSGYIVFSDESVFAAATEMGAKEFAMQAEDDGFIIVNTEDEAELRFEILLNGEKYPIEDVYEKDGGTFRLEIPSGVLRIWDPSASTGANSLEMESGTFALTMLKLDTGDLTKYSELERDAIGEGDWNYLERINHIGLAGCGSLVLAVALGLVPFTRNYWWVFVPILLLPHVLMFLLQQTKRYKQAEQKRLDFQKQQPHLILRLEKAEELSSTVKGGTLMAY